MLLGPWVLGTAWFVGPWPSAWSSTSITLLELFPLIVAAHVWGHRWQRLQVQFRCDNAAVVAILNSGSFLDQPIMHLVRRLTLVACRQHFSFSAHHIPGHRNAAADALTSLHFQEFHRLLPSADPLPTVLLPFLLHDLLLMCWKRAVLSFWPRILQLTPGVRMLLANGSSGNFAIFILRCGRIRHPFPPLDVVRFVANTVLVPGLCGGLSRLRSILPH